MVKLVDEPTHEFADGVTVITPEIGPELIFNALNDGTVFEPELATPMDVLLFVQLNAVPVTLPANAVTGTVAPLQYVALGTVLTDGIGLTTTV